jgi:maleylpyruvate isomerase
MKLYNYYRSSASWRVRIALAWKSVAYEYVAVHLLKDGGQQFGDAHLERNPMAQVPALEVEMDGQTRVISQSLAILEFLEEAYPEPALLPADRWSRARARELAETINAGIQPHHNLGPMTRLEAVQPGLGKAHGRHFIQVGLAALEARVRETAGSCCIGDSPTFADVCLVPQLFGARRQEVGLDAYPTLLRIEAHLNTIPAFITTHPDRQPDSA